MPAIGQLEFPFRIAPAFAQTTQIAPGLHWAVMPLPFRLNHVNIWLLEEDDGWTVIDTGCATQAITEAWEALFAGSMRAKPARRLIATHGHVDHVGLASWLVDRFEADYVSTFAEWIWSRVSHVRDIPGANQEHRKFLARHGFDGALAEQVVKRRGYFMDLSWGIPGAINEIRDGQVISFGGRDWRVIVTRGHAHEHASFYCAADNILIAGDHLLPKISPVIMVSEMAPRSDPLGDYLASFQQFADIPSDVLVLPSHGMPYRGLHNRMDQLRAHHLDRLGACADLVTTPKSAFDLSKAMFPHIDGPENAEFAFGEALAHLNYLVKKDLVHEEPAGQGLVTFHLAR